MTREEILNMPAGYELDALIYAQVFGKMAFKAKGEWEFTNERDYLDAGEAYYLGEHQEIIRLPRYSIDMGAAWRLVDKLGKKETTLSFRGKFWFCDFGNQDDFEFSQAETAPLAICRAALLAVL